MSAGLTPTLVGIVGQAHCLAGADRSAFVVDGRTPYAVVFPGTVGEASRVVAAAAAAGVPVIPWGGGTQLSLGALPPDGAVVVVTRRLNRVVEHEPGDLTATVEGGITLDALQAELAAKGQWWSLDPPFPARATLGGVLATNASGPRRFLYGTARDLVIGMRVVGPDGALVQSGGKVVTNVAGNDLVNLYIGSLGTLGLIVEATLKLRPRPEADRVCWAGFASLEAATAAALTVMGSDLIPHSLELLDADAARVGASAVGLAPEHRVADRAALLVGFDGLPTTVAWQVAEAGRLLRGAGARGVMVLDGEPAQRALQVVRDVREAVPEPLAVARVAVLPADVGVYAGEAGHTVRAAGLRLLMAAHAGSGVLTLVLTTANGEGPGVPATVKVLARLREQARARGGQFVVEWAPLAVREEALVWDDGGPAVRLMQRIKAQIDPQGIMNPGRFVGGI
jgi:glycolate dehydrogenase FAD-binding subunit